MTGACRSRAVARSTDSGVRHDGCMSERVSEALQQMVELLETMPGTFRGEFQLGFWGGVTGGADAWSIRVEADIVDGEFFVTAQSALEALQKGLEETKRRIPHAR